MGVLFPCECVVLVCETSIEVVIQHDKVGSSTYILGVMGCIPCVVDIKREMRTGNGSDFRYSRIVPPLQAIIIRWLVEKL